MKLKLFFIAVLLSLPTFAIAADSPFQSGQFNACVNQYLGNLASTGTCPISLSQMALAKTKDLGAVVYFGSKQPTWSKNLGGSGSDPSPPAKTKQSFQQPPQQQQQPPPVRYPPIAPVQPSPQNNNQGGNGGGITAFQPGNGGSGSSSNQQPNYLQ
jgi:hypothetical protein